MFYDAIVVLGIHMPNGTPPEELVARVRKAADCWIEGYAPTVIPCGGQRSDELYPESMYMTELLINFGLPVTAVRPETESLNTEQNLLNAKKMIEGWGGKSAIVVTSDIHMHRTLAVCRQIGLPAKGMSIQTRDRSRFRAWIIEALGWVEYKLGWQRNSTRRKPNE